jgi:hypothetical protein
MYLFACCNIPFNWQKLLHMLLRYVGVFVICWQSYPTDQTKHIKLLQNKGKRLSVANICPSEALAQGNFKTGLSTGTGITMCMILAQAEVYMYR